MLVLLFVTFSSRAFNQYHYFFFFFHFSHFLSNPFILSLSHFYYLGYFCPWMLLIKFPLSLFSFEQFVILSYLWDDLVLFLLFLSWILINSLSISFWGFVYFCVLFLHFLFKISYHIPKCLFEDISSVQNVDLQFSNVSCFLCVLWGIFISWNKLILIFWYSNFNCIPICSGFFLFILCMWSAFLNSTFKGTVSYQ